MSFKVKTLKAGEDFPVPPGKVVEKLEFYHSIRGVRQAVRFIGPEETEVEVDDEPDELWFVPFFTNASVAEDVVVQAMPEPPVEPAPLFPPTPAPEDLVVDSTPEPTPEPTIPPAVDVAE